ARRRRPGSRRAPPRPRRCASSSRSRPERAPAGGRMTIPVERVVIGRVVKPHGLKGGVVVRPPRDFPERILAGLRVRMVSGAHDERELQVVAVRPQRDRLLITFEGISDVGVAEELRNAELTVGESEVAPRPPGFVYHWEIEGAEVVDAAGREL